MFAVLLLSLSACFIAGCTGGSNGNANGGSNAQAEGNTPPVKIETNTTTSDLTEGGQFDPERVALQPGPALSFEDTTYNVGKMSETDSVTFQFKFTNTGSGTLSFAEIKPTCTCTHATIAKRDYKPGESGTIDVTFTPTSTGRQTRDIKIASNDLVAPTTTISVVADVEAFITIEPAFLKFGTLLPGTTSTQYVSIFSPDPTMTVKQVNTTDPFIRTRIVQANTAGSAAAPTVGAPGQALIEVSIDENAPWGPLFGWVHVTVTGLPPGKQTPVTHTRSFRVNASVFGDLVADPDTFRAGPTPNEPFERTVRIKRLSGQPFRILEATISDVYTTATLARASIQIKKLTESEYDLVLKGAGGPEIGTFEANVNIKTDVPGEEEIKLKISGRVRGPAG